MVVLWRLSLVALLLSALATGAARAEPPDLLRAGTDHYLGEFRVTYYYVAEESEHRPGLARHERLLDLDGRLLARVSSEFRRELDREGTGRLRDGRVLNVARRIDGAWRYEVLARGAWGRGASGALLVPFVSVAADPRTLPYGSRIHIPELAGLPLPGGGRHGGQFVVSDAGSAIQGGRLDVFIGRRAHLALAEERVPSHAPTAVFWLGPDCPEDEL